MGLIYQNTAQNTYKTRGSDNCCPTAEGGGWAPNGTKTIPIEWRNGALIKMINSKFYKLVWGQQFGFGVRTGQSSPNSSMPAIPSNDPGCPAGCLFDIVADPTEAFDLRNQEPAVFAHLLTRQSEIGLTVYQTNYSDYDDDTACLKPDEMVNRRCRRRLYTLPFQPPIETSSANPPVRLASDSCRESEWPRVTPPCSVCLPARRSLNIRDFWDPDAESPYRLHCDRKLVCWCDYRTAGWFSVCNINEQASGKHWDELASTRTCWVQQVQPSNPF